MQRSVTDIFPIDIRTNLLHLLTSSLTPLKQNTFTTNFHALTKLSRYLSPQRRIRPFASRHCYYACTL